MLQAFEIVPHVAWMAENVEKTKLYYGENCANEKCEVYCEPTQFVQLCYGW